MAGVKVTCQRRVGSRRTDFISYTVQEKELVEPELVDHRKEASRGEDGILSTSNGNLSNRTTGNRPLAPPGPAQRW